MKAESISAAAIEQDGVVHSLPKPARHHDIIQALSSAEDHRALISRPRIAGGRQGFLTSYGRFVTREEAREIAIAAGQVASPRHKSLLFTEDLW